MHLGDDLRPVQTVRQHVVGQCPAVEERDDRVGLGNPQLAIQSVDIDLFEGGPKQRRAVLQVEAAEPVPRFDRLTGDGVDAVPAQPVQLRQSPRCIRSNQHGAARPYDAT